MKWCCIALGCLLPLGLAQAQIKPPEVRNLSLDDCLSMALEHNFDVKIKRLEPEISRYGLNAIYGNYDPNVTAAGVHRYSLSPGGVDAEGRPYNGNELETDQFNGGLQGLTPWGLTYNVGLDISDTYGTRPGVLPDTRNPFENSGGTMGIASLRQPLLRNFWIDNTRLQIQLARQNLKLSELDFRYQMMRTITDTEQAYYNLIFAQENVKVQQAALGLADRLLAENRKRVEVGALAPLDEKQAEAQTASSRADLLDAEGEEDTRQRVLKNLLSEDYSKWAEVRIKPTINLVAIPERYDLQESWRIGLRQRPDLEQQRVNVEKQGYVVKFQRNQLFPQVDAIGSYGYAGSSDEFSGSFNQLGRGDNPYWSYGGQLSVPLTRTSARNNYKSAKATREQLDLQLRQYEQGVLIQIENAIAAVNTSFQRVSARREARIYAEAALDAEQKKLQSGKSTSFEVLRLQRDLTLTRSQEIRALADYNIAVSQAALAVGSTLDRRQVKLDVH